MGRLGFNLVRQKEAVKVNNVEAGLTDAAVVVTPTAQTDQQNQSNESVEMSELLLTIDERNRTIKNLRLLSVILTTVIILLCGYIVLTESRFNHRDQAASTINKLEEYTNKMEALQGQYDAAMETIKLEKARNCSLQEEGIRSAIHEKFQSELDAEKIRQTRVSLDASERTNALQAEFNDLKAEYLALDKTCSAKQNEQQEELRKLQVERADLLTKLEASQRKARQRSNAQPPTTTTTTTTTTPAPTRAPRRGFFDNDSMKKINDLVKDIESVGRAFGSMIVDAF